MKAILTILTLTALSFFAGAAAAQTADGSTPAEESVCDGLSGAPWGLCNAYCEAMDCHLDEPHASQQACTKVGDKYEQIQGSLPPCETPDVACPCLDATRWSSGSIAWIEFANGERGITQCTDSGGDTILEEDLAITIDSASVITTDPQAGLVCVLQTGSADGSTTDDSVSLAPDEAASCAQALRDAAAARNVTCG